MNADIKFQSRSSLRAEDIPVSSLMIETGLAILEETNDQPLSRLTVERAFQEMFLCALRVSVGESSDLP
ncbi:hypothetical protein ALP72_02141 [Pseudomonas coronafaciens pv. coronafaciens]|nr:hypothetical protein ALP72_02141 [Pseudomonas coronafaciens pv. coronafaciens]